MTFCDIKFAAVAAILAAGLVVSGRASPDESAEAQAKVELAAMRFAPYERQRVVYQVDEGGGWFGHAYLSLVNSLEHHVAAVGVGNLDIRVILQGSGLDLLRTPDPALRARIDGLRAQGVRFLVCRNSLIERGLAPSTLHGLGSRDIVRAAVAEIAALEAQGFVYIHL